jgi:hypothetical protein
VLRPRVMIVEEFGQLLAQAFVALAFVAENDGPFEQGLLKLLRQVAPKVCGGRSEDEKVTVLVRSDVIRCSTHENLTGAHAKVLEAA